MKKIKLLAAISSLPILSIASMSITSCGDKGNDPAVILSKIEVKTNPTKISYKQGEKLDLTGMVVVATYSDNSTKDVTSECTTFPSTDTPLTKGTTEVTVTHSSSSKTSKFSIFVDEAGIIGITITPPSKTKYETGDKLVLDGFKVLANWSDSRTPTDVTSECTIDPNADTPLTPDNNKVTVTHTSSGFKGEFDIKVYSSFTKDSWTNVINYANQGLDKLKEVYGVSTFVGLERSVTINNVEHIFRVIGENHDDVYDESSSTITGKAALTFELVTLYSDSNGDAYTTIYDYASTVTYEYDSYIDSNLRNNLMANLINNLPAELQAGIKTVRKSSTRFNSISKVYSVSTYTDKLFPLTYCEMAQTSTVQDGQPYKYWQDHNTLEDRIKKDVKGVVNTYWLTSDYTSDSTNNYAWTMHYSTDFTKFIKGDKAGVSFAFCI